MVDCRARDMMLKAIRSYMNEEISALKFGDVIMDASSTTDDMVSVLALFFVMLPERDTESRIKTPEPSAGANGLVPNILT